MDLNHKHKEKIRVGVIYAPQENVTPNNQLKIMYEDIREQIKIGKEEKQYVTSWLPRWLQCKDRSSNRR